jgi:Family of unknown function (DUF6399)
LVAIAPVRNSILWEPPAEARAQAPWPALLAPALAGLTGRVIQATSDDAPGLWAYGEHHRGAPHSPALFHVQHAGSQAVAVPRATKPRAAAKAVTKAEETRKQAHASRAMAPNAPGQRGPGRPPTGGAHLAQVTDALAGARAAPPRLSAPRAQGTQGLRARGHADHWVDLARGVRRNGTRIAGALQAQRHPSRAIAPPAALRPGCLQRSAQAERVMPTMPATIEGVAGYVRQQVSPRALPQPASDAMPAQLIPSESLARVAAPRTGTAGAPRRARAARRRLPLCASGGALSTLSLAAQDTRTTLAGRLAEVCQRSHSNVEGRHGSLAWRNHQRRGLEPPRKRACLTAIQNFCLTGADGTTAAERFFGQKPRAMFAAIVASVAIPPAPRSPPQRARG